MKVAATATAPYGDAVCLVPYGLLLLPATPKTVAVKDPLSEGATQLLFSLCYQHVVMRSIEEKLELTEYP